jgi:hypothetical protein
LNNPEAAEKFGENRIEKAKSIHALVEVQDAAALLSEIYEKTGNYGDALRYNKLYKTMTDSVAEETIQNEPCSFSQVQGELDKQKQSALILSQENKIRDQQLHESNVWRNGLIAGLVGLLF